MSVISVYVLVLYISDTWVIQAPLHSGIALVR